MTPDPAASPPARVLLAEDEPHLGAILETFLVGRGHHVTRVADGRAALEALHAARFDVALLDVVMPELDGLEVLGALRELPLAPEAVVMTGNGTAETVLHALRLGAYDYLTKPYRMAEVELLVRRAAEKRALRRAAAAAEWARAATAVAPESEHPPLRASLARAVEAARGGRLPGVVVGESGTGRATLARHLVRLAAPSAPAVPLLEVTCRGDARDGAALWGAPADDAATRLGAVALAAGSCLLLREAHRLGPAEAAALARAADDVCLMATLHEGATLDPVLAVRLDARGRLALPPLRERVVDIGCLTRRFLALGAWPADRVADEAIARLATERWPGNLAELRRVVQRAAWYAEDGVVTGDALARAGVGEPARSLAELEARQIARALQAEDWHRGRAAARLGISPRTLYRKIRGYGIDRPSA